MTQSLRSIKLRIKGIENTKKITKAMEMVSASKLNRARKALYQSRSYFSKFDEIFNRLLASISTRPHPLLEKREEVRSIALCVITSDAGLCGNYNHNIISVAEDFINRTGRDRTKVIVVGREGYNYFRRHGRDMYGDYMELHGRYSARTAQKLLEVLTGLFLRRQADEVYIAYTHFESTLRHKGMVEKLLNVEGGLKAGGIDYIIEPDTEKVLEELIPIYTFEKLRTMFLNAFTSEHSARMIAMKTATDNADELIDNLILLRNKVRQAAITKEVLEIASTAEALKG